MRELEHLVADAADPSLSYEERTVARRRAAEVLPPSSPVIERMRTARANRSKAAKRTNAQPERISSRIDDDRRKLQALRRVHADEDGRRRSNREVKRLLDELGVRVSPRKIAELRQKL
jgi:hypothetical protein